MSTSADALSRLNPSYAIEAEFGDRVVDGAKLTLAHHGPRSTNPPPCVAEIPKELRAQGGDVFVLSHLDLDSAGGIARCLGRLEYWPDFWRAAGHVDVRGPHRIDEAIEDAVNPEQVRRALHAYWAWSEANRLFPPRDGEVIDVTDHIWETLRIIELIFKAALLQPVDDANEAADLIRKGEEWFKTKEALEGESFWYAEGDVLVRKSDQFVNHLYTHNGRVYKGVAALSLRNMGVTISLESPIEGVSCCEVVQGLWGPEAGGHAGIAGGPRGKEFGDAELKAAAKALNAALSR